MNCSVAFFRLYILIVFVYLLSSCQKGGSTTTPLPPVSSLPDTITVGLKSVLPEVLKESSGLCYTDGAMWSFGDSGNPNELFKIDTTTGAILQTVTITNYPNKDWEDITADSNFIYVGDFGNNYGNRKDLKILRIKKADLTSNAAQLSVTADAISFSYADQTSFSTSIFTNFDCEAMVAVGDSMYIFSKDADLQTRCYPVSKIPGTYTISPVASFNVDGRITAACYNPATKELALLGYKNIFINSFIWFFDNYNGTSFFAGEHKKFTIGNATTDWQTEGLDYISSSRLMMSCESTSAIPASLYYVQKQ